MNRSIREQTDTGMSSFFHRLSGIVLMGVLASGGLTAGSKTTTHPGSYVPVGADTIARNGYTLIFINQDKTFDPQVKHKMVHTFFQVYPALAKQFNPATLTTVTFVIDTTYDGVAGAASGQVSYSPEWLRKHPGDIDVVTHEVMHIVQNYPGDAGPGWVTEGIADYVRYKFGLDNAGAGWALPEYQHGHSYTNSYRITARFLAWIEQKVKPGFVTSLDASMRTKKYAAATWQQLTGKTTDELWKAYSENPAL